SQIVPKGHCRLIRLESEIRVLERHGSGESIKRFESLDGIAFHRSSNALPNRAVEIDKDFCPEEFVHFIDACAMPSDQPLDGSWLIGRVVVNVHLWVPTPTLHHFCYEGLKCLLLFRAGERPKGFVGWLLARIRGQRHDADEVFQALVQ